MAIVYDKLFALLKEKGYTSYKIRKENIIGQGTLTAVRRGGGLNAQTLNELRRKPECQPGDLMEYVPDEEAAGQQPE